MENLQYLILEEIYLRYGSRTGTSLHTFIKEKLHKKPSDLEFTIDIKSTLQDLEERDIITWKAEPMVSKGSNFPDSDTYKNSLGTEVEGKKQTFENIYVEVQLTRNKGLDYARDIFDREVTRKSILWTNKWMGGLTGILVVTAIATIIIQIKQCCISQQQLRQGAEQKQNCKSNSPAPISNIKDTSVLTHYKDTTVIKTSKKN